MKLKKYLNNFFAQEKSTGILLIICTFLSLLLANSFLKDNYFQFWNIQLNGHNLIHWINDGLMAIFFLMIGLELKREIIDGELSSIKNASLPIFGAIGGMLIPAGIFLIFNFGTPAHSGAGIPMATDIAFAIGILSILGKRVPPSLKILLTAIAVIDDLGAIIIIAVFYTQSLSVFYLLSALGIFGLLLLLNKLNVKNLIPYFIGGIFMWYFMLHSGVHATITGVLLAFTIPYNTNSEKSPSHKLLHGLHIPVSFFILPVFALANTCISINEGWQSGLCQSLGLGIIAGLVIGKPLGIFLFSYLFVALGVCNLPKAVNWNHVTGVGFLGGIGFTMSIFITLLAFEDPEYILYSKIAILISSLVAGLAGYFWLKKYLPKKIN